MSEVYCNYMGYVDWDDQRYFDVREIRSQKLVPEERCLESDSRLRIDSMQLKRDVELAQLNKEELERN